jgi:hypothetical protein
MSRCYSGHALIMLTCQSFEPQEGTGSVTPGGRFRWRLEIEVEKAT